MSLEVRVPGMVGVLLGRERVNESLLFGLHLRVYQACLGIVPPGASRTLPDQQLPTAAVPSALSQGHDPQRPSPGVSAARRRVVPCRLSWHPSTSERKKGGTPVLGGAFPRSRLALHRACSHFPKPCLAAGNCLGSVPTQTQPEGRV